MKENTRDGCGYQGMRILGYLAAHSDMSRHHHPPQTDMSRHHHTPQTDMSRQGLQIDMG